MKRLIIITFTLLAFGGLGYLVVAKDDPATPKATTNSPATVGAASPGSAKQVGKYTTYSDNIIANTSGTKLVFFHAPWCPQCRALEASITGGTIPSDVTIIKVDYDTNQKLRQQYGVTIQTTLIKVDDQGKLVKKYVAYDEPTLDSVIKNLL